MEVLDIQEIIHKDLLVVDSKATTKGQILKELADLLERKGYVASAEIFLTDVYQRESEGTTGIGQGIAIPHGKSTTVNQTVIIIATLAQPIPWETLDDQDVKVVLLFAVKAEDANLKHLRLLQKIATLLADNEFIHKLKEVDTVEALYQLMINQ